MLPTPLHTWVIATLANVVYSTVIIGGIAWYKFRKLRLTILAEYDEIRKQMPPVGIGEVFARDTLERLEQTMREHNARLAEIESRLDRLIQEKT